MTKQDLIRAEWEKVLPEGVTWESIKDEVCINNGWLCNEEMEKHKISENNMDNHYFESQGYMNHFCRPKSLKDIEDNNGWLRIEDGLPTEENNKYHVGKLDLDGNFIVSSDLWDSEDLRLMRIYYYTHYRPHNPLPKPLY